MISKKRLEKFNNKKPDEPLDNYEIKHFDELMKCSTPDFRQRLDDFDKKYDGTKFAGYFHEAVEETIKDLDRLLP